MINQQLVDYIKQQLKLGVPKEKISVDLSANGWNLQDIAEAFRASVPPPGMPGSIPAPASPPPPATAPITFTPKVSPSITLPPDRFKSHSHKKAVTWGIVIAIILVIGAGAYYFSSFFTEIPIIKDIIRLTGNSPTYEEIIPATEETGPIDDNLVSDPVIAAPVINIYTDPNGLYSFTYPAEARLETSPEGMAVTKMDIENGFLATAIAPDINYSLFNSLPDALKKAEKIPFGTISSYPIYKYSAAFAIPGVNTTMYAIDLGTHENSKMGILIISVSNGTGADGEIEKIVTSLAVNDANIIPALKNILAKKAADAAN